MPGTWKEKSTKYIGYVARPSLVNQRYVTVRYAQDLIAKGYSSYQIGLIYNGGEPKEKKCTNCKVPYDSGAYARRLLGFMTAYAEK